MFVVIFLIAFVLIFAPTIMVFVAKFINWEKERVIKSYETTREVFKR